MLPSHKQTIAQLLSDAVGSLLPEGMNRPEIVLERPKQAAHGDIACNVALQLAKPLGTNPRLAARACVARGGKGLSVGAAAAHGGGRGGVARRAARGTRTGAPTLGRRRLRRVV